VAQDYQVEIRGTLPAAVQQELGARFGVMTVDRKGDRTVLSGLTGDQAALAAVLRLLWDLGTELRLVKVVDRCEEENHD
jgi:hypothetical protein